MTRIRIEVVYAGHGFQVSRRLDLDSGATIATAISGSGICRDYPEIDLAKNRVGIFGQRLGLEALLSDGDRVEIYRPLIADPKDSRRKRADLARKSRR